ncbi:MAG: hypothetical protein ACE5GE_05590 [Phycisphaerae bacterium]
MMTGQRIHGSRISSLAALLVGAVSATGNGVQPESAKASGRCGPAFVHVEPDTGHLLVLCEKNDTIMRIDSQTGTALTVTPLSASPFALCPHPDGRRLYVTCRRGQEIVELDNSSFQILRRFELRGDPTGVAVSGDGARLYVGVHSLDQIAVFDLESGRPLKRLAAGNGPEMVRLSPAQGRVYVTNLLSNPVGPNEPCRNEVTIIDDTSSRVTERVILENANIGRGIAATADGSLAIAAISRPKNLVPMVQVARGGVVTNGFVVLTAGSDTPPVQLLVDLPNQSYADPYGLVITHDDRTFYLTCAGADTVIAVDLASVRAVVKEAAGGLIAEPADHLGLSRRYVTARIRVGANPTSLALSEDGRWLYVANRLDDTISVIDTARDAVVRTLVIGDAVPEDRRSRGERLFFSAARTFQGQFSCSSCHPDCGFDGLQYDLEPDGIGQNILDNRNLRGVAGTGPFKWVGSNPGIATQCGTRTAQWIVRTGWLSWDDVVTLAAFVRSIEPVSNPYRSPDGSLTAAQRRGQALFERTTTNRGDPIPERSRCDYCHSGPKFTDGRRSDVGTKAAHDTAAEFDSAHLPNIFESAPYLHDGRAATLEEIWTRYNADDTHGVSSDWTKQQLNDLVEYLKIL